jgi:hypothetical protein
MPFVRGIDEYDDAYDMVLIKKERVWNSAIIESV